jgi:hypothetical protein
VRVRPGESLLARKAEAWTQVFAALSGLAGAACLLRQYWVDGWIDGGFFSNIFIAPVFLVYAGVLLFCGLGIWTARQPAAKEASGYFLIAASFAGASAVWAIVVAVFVNFIHCLNWTYDPHFQCHPVYPAGLWVGVALFGISAVLCTWLAMIARRNAESQAGDTGLPVT